MIKIDTKKRKNNSFVILIKKIKTTVQKIIITKEAINDIKNLNDAVFAKKKELPLFNHIEIETLNKCNGTCSFCPVNKNLDPRPLAKMSDEIFRKIIDNLAKLNYTGDIAYYSNNEPLMDKRIYDFIKYGTSKLPNAAHSLCTNGTLLDIDKFQKLIDSGLNQLDIDNYSNDLKLNPNIQEIYDEYKNKNFSLNCEIHLRPINDVLGNRGGSAPNKSKKLLKIINAPCNMPFSSFIIRADCGVSLCCNDALGKMTLGNINEQTIEEIWNSKERLNILQSMHKNMRNDIEICKYCDVISSSKHWHFWFS